MGTHFLGVDREGEGKRREKKWEVSKRRIFVWELARKTKWFWGQEDCLTFWREQRICCITVARYRSLLKKSCLLCLGLWSKLLSHLKRDNQWQKGQVSDSKEPGCHPTLETMPGLDSGDNLRSNTRLRIPSRHPHGGIYNNSVYSDKYTTPHTECRIGREESVVSSCSLGTQKKLDSICPAADLWCYPGNHLVFLLAIWEVFIYDCNGSI